MPKRIICCGMFIMYDVPPGPKLCDPAQERRSIATGARWPGKCRLGGVMLILIYNSVKILNVNLFNNRAHLLKILGSAR